MNPSTAVPRRDHKPVLALTISAIAPILYPPLALIGLIWGIIYAASDRTGPALAIWMTTTLAFVLSIGLRFLIAPG